MQRAGDERYVVLGGQHTVRACQLLLDEFTVRGEVPPPAIAKVQATILSPTTPLDVRQRLAGNHQMEQTTVHGVAFSRLVGLIHTALTRDMFEDDFAIMSAIQKSGHPRPTKLRAMRNVYLKVLRFVETLGAKAEDVVARWELKGEKVYAASFKAFEQLLTPEARQSACAGLADTFTSLKDFQARCTRATLEMWAGFHWRQGNPFIDPEKSVFPLHHCYSM